MTQENPDHFKFNVLTETMKTGEELLLKVYATASQSLRHDKLAEFWERMADRFNNLFNGEE